MVKHLFFYILLLCTTLCFSQQRTIKVSEKLSLTQLNTNTYIHTADYSNGVIYVVNKEAVIISTPSTDDATKELLDWITNSLKAEVKACIVDHWHTDAMEGIDILHEKSIPTYAYTLTKKIAKEKGLDVPKNTFSDSLVFPLGDRKIIARYFGPSHSADDIVVWLPDEKILFGSCGVKGKGGWVGNIADAHLGEWSTTIEKVKVAYPNAKTVVPGHGKHGDTSLLGYTIEMFKPLITKKPVLSIHPPAYQKVDTIGNYRSYIFTSLDSRKDTIWHQTILINKDSIIIVIHALDSNTQLSKNSFKVKEGSFTLLNNERTETINGFVFKNLTASFRDDELGMSIVIEEFFIHE